jgi:hypothetical protein
MRIESALYGGEAIEFGGIDKNKRSVAAGQAGAGLYKMGSGNSGIFGDGGNKPAKIGRPLRDRRLT